MKINLELEDAEPIVNYADEKEVFKTVKQIYSDRYVKVSDNEYILVGSPLHNIENDEDCDVEWIKKGYVTVTPVLFNKTNYERITEVKGKSYTLKRKKSKI